MNAISYLTLQQLAVSDINISSFIFMGFSVVMALLFLSLGIAQIILLFKKA